MEVLWSPWVIGSIIVYIVILVVSWAIADDEHGDKGSGFGTLALTLVIFAVISVIFNSAFYIIGGDSVARHSTAPELAEEFGLESGQSYALVVGDRVGGSAGEASASAGLFSARASVNLQPASALSIDFTHGDKSFVLELPMSGITFIQSTTEEPSVTLHLADKVHEYESRTYVGVSGTSDTCTTVIRNLMLACVATGGGQRVEMSETTARRGLSPIVQDHFDSASITLTPGMYYELLGAEQPKREE